MTTYAERLRRRFLNTVKPVGNVISSVGKTIGNGIVSASKNPVVQDVAMGALLLKKGGLVPGKKGAPRRAIVHGGEYMLPSHVKPTASQIKKVNAGKRKKKA